MSSSVQFVLGPLGAVRQRGQQREPFGEDGRIASCEAWRRTALCPRLLRIVHGARDLAAALEVDGELGRHLPRPAAVAPGLQRVPPPASVQLRTPRRSPADSYRPLLVAVPGETGSARLLRPIRPGPSARCPR